METASRRRAIVHLHWILLLVGTVCGIKGTVQSQLTDRFEVVGSPCYMSPEQCRGTKLDFRSDIYSLGRVMYEAITGEKVFYVDNPFEMLAKQLTIVPKPFAEICPDKSIPAALERIIFKALAKNPCDRFKSIVELREALATVLATEALEIVSKCGLRQLLAG